jgi:hypothetical protein
MVTVLEDCTTEEQHSVVNFLWAKGLSGKDIHKEMFPVYSGKYLSHKAIYNWLRNVADVSLMRKGLKRRCRSD